MPAIQPALLDKQIENLFKHYDSLDAFILILKDVLDYYADRTRRPGRQSLQSPLVRSSNVSRQVSKKIEMTLEKYVKSQPETGLKLADLLWQESWLECWVLAFLILGWLPIDQTDEIKNRVNAWCKNCGFNRTIDASLARGITLLWKSSPDLMMNQIELWLASSDQTVRKWGLRVVNALVDDPTFFNYPVVFNLLTPFVHSVGAAPDSDLLIAVRNLAQKAPQETAYFLKRSLTASENTDIYVLIRQSLDMFSSPTRQDLRDFLHQMREQFGEK